MWSTFALSPKTTYVVRFPTASIYIRAEGVLWGVAVEYPAKPQRAASCAPVKNPPKNLSWRYSALLDAAELTIRPMLSLKPYEIQIPQPISILPEVEIDGYMFLPLQAEILVSKSTVLASIPLGPRKTSWFGSHQEGILCDAIVSSFSAEEEVGRFLADPAPAIAICPVTISNNMVESMDLARLCIPTDFLSVYSRGGFLATDRVICSFSPEGLQVKPKRGMDPLLGKMDVRHPARKGPETTFFSKSIGILRYIAGI